VGDFLFIAECYTFKSIGIHTIYGMEKKGRASYDPAV